VAVGEGVAVGGRGVSVGSGVAVGVAVGGTGEGVHRGARVGGRVGVGAAPQEGNTVATRLHIMLTATTMLTIHSMGFARFWAGRRFIT